MLVRLLDDLTNGEHRAVVLAMLAYLDDIRELAREAQQACARLGYRYYNGGNGDG